MDFSKKKEKKCDFHRDEFGRYRLASFLSDLRESGYAFVTFEVWMTNYIRSLQYL